MTKILFALFFLLSVNHFSQVTVDNNSLSFPQLIVGNSDSISIYIKNQTSANVGITLSSLKSVYKLSDTLLTINSGDSNLVWIKYKPVQNIIDKDLLIIKSPDGKTGIVIDLNGSGKFGDSYDATTFNLYDAQLKTALNLLVINHTDLKYSPARDIMFMTIDNKKVNGQGATQNTLECVYTGRLAIGYTNRTNAQDTSYNFNTEHTWPQHNFNEAEPMKSDLFHLYPTDNPANGKRSNYPFGKVVSNITWQSNGSKLGNNNSGQIVFEPRDIHKGDVSRSMFYFITRYPQNYGGFFTVTQENVFREWNKFDTVGTIESARNTAIAKVQLKRNPFIDHPEFADRIYSFSTSAVRPVTALIDVLPQIVDFDSTKIGVVSNKEIYIADLGSGQLIIDSISISDKRFSLNSFLNTVNPFSYQKVMLQFTPDSIKTYNAFLTVYSKSGNKKVTISGTGKDNTVAVEDESIQPAAFVLKQNYPNPFNPATTIEYSIPESAEVTISIYSALGELVTTLVNGHVEAGNHQITFNGTDITSGVYFYQLKATGAGNNYFDAKKMVIIK